MNGFLIKISDNFIKVIILMEVKWFLSVFPLADSLIIKHHR